MHGVAVYGRTGFMIAVIGACPILVYAGAAPLAQPQGGAVAVSIGRAGEISLEAREAPLARVFAELSKATGAPIRYSAAPEAPVSAACHGESLKRVLLCLLGTEADLIFQYSGRTTRGASSGGLTGVKVLASTFVEGRPLGSGVSEIASSHPASDAANLSTPVDNLDDVLAMTQSLDPEQRAQGLEKLGRVEGVEEDTLRAAYRAGLADDDGDVRAAAISGMALLDQGGDVEWLKAAMNDRHASARLAALDSLGDDARSRPYLIMALSDPDESVRVLAEMRLGIQ
jgi:hypothetical protein